MNIRRRARLPWREAAPGAPARLFSSGEKPVRELKDPDGIPLLVRG